ncbi:efflux RND transporter periplasmic adaptor subunit [Alteromonas sp. K632G]|jgi:Cu(I)/Ag(I) efflux system membrane fusion protein|uniref:efflux RND transporter periplasmic adaptor subunit n=1 Tax=Alteromonas sp. K632G TaxID=2820757 RepID=UPI000C122014|nr:efflux RND transporter periplasmic adaptor subunit [Alteromonas sp. K632G]MBO7922351.1 efflux RND transporter periplasmic adaptor subunit [Alteromonas sp. K632G]PHS59987.1 MAG: efflux transporter periplasmic adaptor subunit [Alteromonas sp.]
MKNTSTLAIGLFAGAVITALVYTYMMPTSHNSLSDSTVDADKPLYWVAPMDPNYRRDTPGKSPMGMDLIPVYDDGGNNADSPGTIKIHPNVENNLGVRTAKVEKKALHVPIRTVGYVQYNEDTLVHIHPRVEGWIDNLYVKAAGDYVKKGEPLYALYSPELVNAQEEYLLARTRNNKNLIEAASSRLEALQMPASAIKKLNNTGKVQHTITFTAPQTGFVDNLNVRQGFYVKPGITILSIGALDEVWVDAEIFERQSNLIEEGLAVTMTLEYLPGKEWQGQVDYVYPTLDEKTRTLKARLRFENPDYFLKPNMFAQVTIHSDLDDENLLVPTEAVIRTGTQDRVVLALGEGRFKSVEVEVGNIVNEYTEILAGLNKDDRIVTSAQFLLDSESSISSDFKRMEEPDAAPTMVWTTATINSVMIEHRMVNLDHAEIEDWGWPSMTMDFNVADDIDISQLSAGMSLHLQITKLDTGDYLVNTIHIVDEDGNMMQMENMDGMNDDENMDDMDGMHDMHNMNDMDKSAKPDTTKMEVDHSSHRGQHQ